MNVTVRFSQADGNGSWEVTLSVKSSDTIGDLKQAVQKCKGIPVEKQVLQYNSKVFEDEYPLRFFNLNAKTTFYLHCRLNILAITHSRQQLATEIDPYETIASLKVKIAAVLKKPTERVAIFKDANLTEELNQRRAVLRLPDLVRGREVFVKVFEGPDYFSITAETFTSKVISMIVAGSDTVELTKERLLASLKILNKDFSKFIHLTYNGHPMKDEICLSEYGVQSESVLKIVLVYCDVTRSHVRNSLPACRAVMSFNLRNSFRKVIRLSGVTLFDRVGEIKRKAALFLGVSFDSLLLKHLRRNKFLNNDARALLECGIASPEEELELSDGSTMIYVTNELFGRLHIDLMPDGLNLTSRKLKSLICSVSGVLPGDQSLSFRGASFDSDDEETLASIGVKMMSTLQLSLIHRRRRPLVTVKVTISRHVAKLSLLSSDSVDHLTEETEKKCSMDLSRYSCLNETTMMPIRKSITFGTEPITVVHFEPLKNAEVSAAQCTTRTCGRTANVGSSLSCPPAWPRQPKVVSGTISQPLKQHASTISTCGASNSSLVFSSKIFVALLTGKTYTLPCEPHDSIRQIKERIFNIEGIPLDDQGLVFNSRQLEDDHTLSDYNISNGSKLYLVIVTPKRTPKAPTHNHSFLIFLKTLTGRTLTLHCKPHDSVAQLKEQIYKIEGIPPDEQRLIFAGKQLEDRHSLYEYDVSYECTVHLVVRLRGC